jgi:hypothetical protein
MATPAVESCDQVPLIEAPAHAGNVVSVDDAGQFGSQIWYRHVLHRQRVGAGNVGSVTLRETAGDRSLNLLFAGLADVASDGKAEQMFGIDRFGPPVGRNKRKGKASEPQTGLGQMPAPGSRSQPSSIGGSYEAFVQSGLRRSDALFP